MALSVKPAAREGGVCRPRRFARRALSLALPQAGQQVLDNPALIDELAPLLEKAVRVHWLASRGG